METLLIGGREISLSVIDAGLACCAVEVTAALRQRPGLSGAGMPAGAERGAERGGAGRLHVLVVAGTVTDKLAPFVLRAYQELPEPRRVLSFGACSNSGGPYWDSYSVTKGVDQMIPVDSYVPGCPPRPEALLHGLALLVGAADEAGRVRGAGPAGEGAGGGTGAGAGPGGGTGGSAGPGGGTGAGAGPEALP
jgi:NADH-quinone oxidoreductase subunit B